MDFQAIIMSSAEELQQLGCVKGDAKHVRCFAERKLQEKKQVSVKEGKKRLLEDILSQGSKTKVKPKPHSKLNTSRKKPVRKVNLGWLHFYEATQTYVQVKSTKGGGTRIVDLPILSSKEVIVNAGKKFFFPYGSSKFGTTDEMEFSISNF